MLRHLGGGWGRRGFNQPELAMAYKAIIRPNLDYCCVVYHLIVMDDQDQIVERLQSQALKSIYGYQMY